MSKERINGKIFQLRPVHVFVSPDDLYDRALADVGSRLEGVSGIKEFLINIELKEREDGERKLSDEKRREWDEDIDNKFKEVGEILGIEIPRDEDVHDDLIKQHKAIVRERRDLLTKLSTLVIKS